MKQGTIVYLADANAIAPAHVPEDRAGEATSPLLFAASRAGFYDVPQALLALLSGGCGHVELARGGIGPDGALTLAPERHHLWG